MLTSATDAIAVFAALIAFGHWWTARQKLVLDLFEKRFQVFLDIPGIASEATQIRKINQRGFINEIESQLSERPPRGSSTSGRTSISPSISSSRSRPEARTTTAAVTSSTRCAVRRNPPRPVVLSLFVGSCRLLFDAAQPLSTSGFVIPSGRSPYRRGSIFVSTHRRALTRSREPLTCS
jgi:hypothetical protein